MPIGLVSDNWGGTRVEQWTTAESTAVCGHRSSGELYNAMIVPYSVGPMAVSGFTWFDLLLASVGHRRQHPSVIADTIHRPSPTPSIGHRRHHPLVIADTIHWPSPTASSIGHRRHHPSAITDSIIYRPSPTPSIGHRRRHLSAIADGMSSIHRPSPTRCLASIGHRRRRGFQGDRWGGRRLERC